MSIDLILVMSYSDNTTILMPCKKKLLVIMFNKGRPTMGIIVLLLIGFVIWKCISNAPAGTSKEDREFENMCMSLKDTDDDFDMF